MLFIFCKLFYQLFLCFRIKDKFERIKEKELEKEKALKREERREDAEKRVKEKKEDKTGSREERYRVCL